MSKKFCLKNLKNKQFQLHGNTTSIYTFFSQQDFETKLTKIL